MSRTQEPPGYIVRVRPRDSLIRSGVLSYALLSLPLFGVLYFVGLSRGTWPIALVAHLASILLVYLGFVAYRRTFIAVTPHEIHERSAIGGVKITALSRVSHAIILSTYRNSSTDATVQLLLSDANEKRLVRMRGFFWTEPSIRSVAAASELNIEEDPHPITTKRFFDQHPHAAYWFENRPSLTVLAVIFTLVAIMAIVLALMMLMGIPMDFTG